MPTILRRSEVCRRVGLSHQSIWRKEARGTFPKRVQLGPASVGWLEAEVDGWIEARIAERDARQTAA